MAFTRSELGAVGNEANLPIQFKYRVATPKRHGYAATLTSGVYMGSYTLDVDKAVTWRVEGAAKSDYDALKTLYDTADDPDYHFVGHQDTASHDFTVKFAELDYEVRDGLYDVTGVFRVIG